MPRPRRSPTLLEVIHRKGGTEPGGFPTPTWFGRRSADSPEPAQEPPAEAVADAAAEVPAAPAEGRSLAKSPTTVVVAIGALAIITLVVVQTLRLRDRSGAGNMLAADSPTIAELREAPARPDAMDVIMGRTRHSGPADRTRDETDAGTADSPLASPSASVSESASPAPAQAASTTRTPGLNYVIIETFHGEAARNDAEKAREFLARQGVTATVERIGNRLRLVGTQGFASGDRTLQDNCRRIEALGQKYFASGGRYRFKGCYGKLYTAQGW